MGKKLGRQTLEKVDSLDSPMRSVVRSVNAEINAAFCPNNDDRDNSTQSNHESLRRGRRSDDSRGLGIDTLVFRDRTQAGA